MNRKIGADLKRGFEMTREQLKRSKRSGMTGLGPNAFQGMTDKERALYEAALERIPSAPVEQISPEDEYLRSMSPDQNKELEMELEQLFQNAKPVDSNLDIKRKALLRLKGR